MAKIITRMGVKQQIAVTTPPTIPIRRILLPLDNDTANYSSSFVPVPVDMAHRRKNRTRNSLSVWVAAIRHSRYTRKNTGSSPEASPPSRRAHIRDRLTLILKLSPPGFPYRYSTAVTPLARLDRYRRRATMLRSGPRLHSIQRPSHQ